MSDDPFREERARQHEERIRQYNAERAAQAAKEEEKRLLWEAAIRTNAPKWFHHPVSPTVAKLLTGPSADEGGNTPSESGWLRQLDSMRAWIKAAWEHSGVGPRHAARFENQHPEWQKVFDHLRGLLGTGFLVAILGPRGTGKSQLGACLCRAEIERCPSSHPFLSSPVKYMTVMDFFLQVKATFKNDSSKSEQSILQSLESPRLLVLDEVQERTGSDFENRLLTHLVDARYQAKRDTLLIGNLSAAALAESLGPSIASRMEECGGAIKMEWDSFRGTQ